MKPLALLTLALAVPLGAALPAQAAFNAPIAFAQAGSVTLTVDFSEGGFDHLLELSDVDGLSGSFLMALTASSDPSAEVLGLTPAALGDSVALGEVEAGQEIVLRVRNIGSFRLGTPGELGPEVYTGTASAFNPTPTGWYSFVEALSPTTLRVRIEDLFPTDPGSGATVLEDYDLQFTLTLQPVPEPGTLALWLAGLGMAGFMARRRA